jgi:hypothetical protein
VEPSGTRHSCQIHEEGPPVDPHLSVSKNPRTTFFIHAWSNSPTPPADERSKQTNLRPRRSRGSPRATSLGDNEAAAGQATPQPPAIYSSSSTPPHPPCHPPRHPPRICRSRAPPQRNAEEQPRCGARRPNHARAMEATSRVVPSRERASRPRRRRQRPGYAWPRPLAAAGGGEGGEEGRRRWDLGFPQRHAGTRGECASDHSLVSRGGRKKEK